jgi:eukaryotic-like serine/threonine-protein kinase
VLHDRKAAERERRATPELDALSGGAPTEHSLSGAPGRSETVLPPGAVVGRFIVHRTLGIGGAGVVYAAHDPELDRTIALKVLRGELADRPDAQARFLREAQALARLSHPNVIAVYDVGAADGRTFIAMEYISGQTFADWVARARPRWQQIVAVLVKAGRGLAAAHAAGLVHRDFKPANMLVGADGRVVVTDFGLARAVAQAEAEAEAGDAPTESTRASAFSRSITMTGAVQGTPAYMAPEQRAGLPGDSRADQFSFCVTLHEALFGEHPFLPPTSDEEATPPRDWPDVETAPRAPSDARRVPAWLERAVQRGLRWKPEDRHPSMDSLLVALGRVPLLRRRGVQFGLAIGAALVAGGIALGAAAPTEPREESCSGGRQQLSSVWNPSVMDRVRSAFAATGRPHAQASADRVAKQLDAHVSRWADMHRATCLATLRGEQSPNLLDRRMACLSRRLDQTHALLDLFVGRPDGHVVDQAVGLVTRLEPLDTCADASALLAGVALPTDPAQRARAIELERRADRAEVERQAGRLEQAATEARAVVAAAEDYPPAAAQAGRVLGRSLADLGRWADAREALIRAQAAAAQAADIKLSTELLLDLFVLVSIHEQRRDEADLLAKLAQAAIERPEVRGERAMRTRLLSGLAVMASDRGELERAVELQREVLAINRRRAGPGSEPVAGSESDLANTLAELGRVEEAREHHLESLAIRRQLFGDQHPLTADAYVNLGNTYGRAGNRDEARRQFQKALDIIEKMPTYRTYPVLLANMGILENESGNFEKAGTYLATALDISTRPGSDQPHLADWIRHSLGNVHYNRGHFAQALAFHRDVLAFREKDQKTHPSYATSLAAVGEDLRRLGRAAESLTYQRRALAVLDKQGDHPAVGYASACQGLALVDLGRRREAIAPLERALRILAPGDAERGRAAFALARALEPRRPTSKRAKALAKEALEIFTAVHAVREREQVAAYLAKSSLIEHLD